MMPLTAPLKITTRETEALKKVREDPTDSSTRYLSRWFCEGSNQ